jgi:hypothetical protein
MQAESGGRPSSGSAARCAGKPGGFHLASATAPRTIWFTALGAARTAVRFSAAWSGRSVDPSAHKFTWVHGRFTIQNVFTVQHRQCVPRQARFLIRTADRFGGNRRIGGRRALPTVQTPAGMPVVLAGSGWPDRAHRRRGHSRRRRCRVDTPEMDVISAAGLGGGHSRTGALQSPAECHNGQSGRLPGDTRHRRENLCLVTRTGRDTISV